MRASRKLYLRSSWLFAHNLFDQPTMRSADVKPLHHAKLYTKTWCINTNEHQCPISLLRPNAKSGVYEQQFNGGLDT